MKKRSFTYCSPNCKFNA